MTLPKGEKRKELASNTHYRSPEKADRANEVFEYRSAGLTERHGYVPYWLKLVTVSLVIWAAYYLWAYWTPPQ